MHVQKCPSRCRGNWFKASLGGRSGAACAGLFGQRLWVGFILKQPLLKRWLKFNQFSNPGMAGRKNVSLPVAPTKCQGVSIPEPVIVASGL